MKTSRTTTTWRFIRHLLEMLAAMVLGMLVLEPLWPTIDRVELHALVMATNMTIGMAALMAVRRHTWPGIVEMSAAMYAPFIILFVPYWTGVITSGDLFLLGHLLMLPAMLLAMLHRRAEYSAAAHSTHHSGRRPATAISPADGSRSGGERPQLRDPAISPARRHMVQPHTQDRPSTLSKEPIVTTHSGNFAPPQDSVFDVLVIGAGQSGLAIGRQLQQRGRSFLIVDAGPETGYVWRSRWDSLTLFTAARYSGLPGLPFPGDPDSYPTKDAVAQYLQQYATTFRLPIRHHTRVTRVTRDGAGFTIHTDGETYHAAQVVVATGPFQNPVVPAVSDAIGPDTVQLHSSAYRNPEQLPDGPVLVVGAANSGVQIAAELHRTRPVTIACGSATRSLPQRILGRDLFWWLTTTGLFTAPAESRLGRRFRNSGELVIGTSTRRLAKAGVTVRPRVTATDATTVTFADGSTTTPAVIMWATGYRSDYSFIDITGATDHAGAPVHQRGVSPVTGLYFLGLPWQHTRGSALLGFVGADAAHIADHITAAPAPAPVPAA